MRKLLLFLLAVAAGYTLLRSVPAENWRQAWAAIGLADFFQQTLPQFLRAKLTIPESPVAKRAKLLRELSNQIAGVEQELEAIAPVSPDGRPAPSSRPPSGQEVQERIDRARERLAESESALEALREENLKSGIVGKAAERLLDKILTPELPAAQGSADSVGGDQEGGDGSPCRCAEP